MGEKILVVEDDDAIRQAICAYLQRSGFEVCSAATSSRGEYAFRSERPSAVVLDYALPDGHALDLLPRLRAADQDVPILILTGYGSIELAVRAVKLGAVDLLTKPIELAELVSTLRKRLLERPDQSFEGASSVDPFFGMSQPIRDLTEDASLAVRTDSPVLIEGETGSGKGVLARWLHCHGPRSDGPFVALNCSSLGAELLHSELFGHKHGSFTGATQDKQGLLELADGGTLFLDEMGDMEPQLQPKLLTALEDKTFRRLGGLAERTVNVRLVAAVNRDLGELVQSGTLRSDLYYRLSTFVLRIPPLRKRGEDLLRLAERMLEHVSSASPEGAARLTHGAMVALSEHEWPGNFRELRNVLERAVLAAEGEPIRTHHLRFDRGLATASRDEPAPAATLAELEREHIHNALREERGHVVHTAGRLGLARSTLYEKLKALNLNPGDYRA